MISVVLNVYKRPHMLDQQIDAVLGQSVPVDPKNIYVMYNHSPGVKQPEPTNKDVNTMRCNWNTTAYGRFVPLLLCKTEYVAVFDDDDVPAPGWFKNCLDTMDDVNGILGGRGIVIPHKGSKDRYYNYGWNGIKSDKPHRVDYVGHAWFFKQEWAKYIWYERPVTWRTGMDMWFSYQAQKYGGINTFVPPHPESNMSIWSTIPEISMKVGRDRNASWRKANWTGERHSLHWHCIRNGWKTVLDLKE